MSGEPCGLDSFSCSTCKYGSKNSGQSCTDINGVAGGPYEKYFEDCTHPKGQCGEEFTPYCAACLHNAHNKAQDPIDDSKSYFDTQVAGDHYDNKYDVAKFCIGNGYGCAESAIIKYAARHERKNGAEDIKKIIHYAQFILEEKYGIRPTE